MIFMDKEELIIKVKDSLNNGIDPERVNMGTFETYLIRGNEHKPIAIFKPGLIREKEEPLRECAAYNLDYQNFAGVPLTTIVTLTHSVFGTRLGSCQAFCEGYSIREGCIPSLDPQSVRRIAILDIRLLNIDRHPNNFLILGTKLIPIDHHLVLPSHFGTCCFAWSDWAAAQTPFSEEERKYVAKLNPENDRRLLLEMGIDLPATNLCFFATHLLKEGIKAGLSAYELSFFFEMRRQSVLLSHFKEIIKNAGYKDRQQLDMHFLEKVKELVSYRQFNRDAILNDNKIF